MPLPSEISERLRAFLAEDIGRGDVTTNATIPAAARARGGFLAKSDLVVCGLDVAAEVFLLLDAEASVVPAAAEGDRAARESTIASVFGRARALLTGERTALNLLQRMCGIATETRRYVEAVSATRCRILDTRKTAPGLRVFDKRAVAAGGGGNHRFGLDDGILIKDNHLRMAGGVGSAVAKARAAAAEAKIEVEVESESQLLEAIDAGADIILFDNQTPQSLAPLVAAARLRRPEIALEASGGIRLENVRAFAETGVDFVSVGALTHSMRAADISLELEIE